MEVDKDLYPSFTINGTNETLATGMTYRITTHLGGVLIDGANLSVIQDNGKFENKLFQLFYSNDLKYYRIYSQKGNALHNGGAKPVSKQANSFPAIGNYFRGDNQPRQIQFKKIDDVYNDDIKWQLIPNGDGSFKIKSFYGNVLVYLKLGGTNQQAGYLAVLLDDETDNIHRQFIKFYFHPYYQLKVSLGNFVFPHNVSQIIDGAKQVALIGQNIVVIGKTGKIEGTVHQKFSKEVTNSASWGLDSKFGLQIGVQISGGIPLIAQAKGSIKTTLEFGAHKEWSTSKTQNVQVQVQLKTDQPGRYMMSGFVTIAENVEIDFKAQLSFSATGARWNYHGGVTYGIPLEGNALVSIMKGSPDTAKYVESINGHSVSKVVTGKMKGTFQLSTYTQMKKLPQL